MYIADFNCYCYYFDTLTIHMKSRTRYHLRVHELSWIVRFILYQEAIFA